MSNVARPKSTKPADPLESRGFWITEDQFIHLLQDVWAMGYAVIPGMPIEEDVIRTCHKSLSDNFCAIEFPGDLFEMIMRVSDRDDAKAAR